MIITQDHFDAMDDYFDAVDLHANGETPEQLFGRKKKKKKGRFKKIFKKVGKALKTATLLPLYGTLLPLMIPMGIIIKKKGKKPAKGIEDRAQQFYKLIINKNYDDDGYMEMSYAEKQNIEPATISLIVSAIIGFFKKMKKKKEEGAQLSPAENEAMNATAKVAKSLSKAAEKDIENETREAGGEVGIGGGMDLKKMLPLIGMAAVLAYFIFRGN